MHCAEKIAYATEAEAERARKQAVKLRNRGRALRWLHVYHCPECLSWHVGHQRRPAPQEPAAPAPKPPSTGDLRRKLERMARQWERQEDYQRRQRAEAIGKLIAAERAVEDAEKELLELQRQVTAMFSTC